MRFDVLMLDGFFEFSSSIIDFELDFDWVVLSEVISREQHAWK